MPIRIRRSNKNCDSMQLAKIRPVMVVITPFPRASYTAFQPHWGCYMYPYKYCSSNKR